MHLAEDNTKTSKNFGNKLMNYWRKYKALGKYHKRLPKWSDRNIADDMLWKEKKQSSNRIPDFARLLSLIAYTRS